MVIHARRWNQVKKNSLDIKKSKKIMDDELRIIRMLKNIIQQESGPELRRHRRKDTHHHTKTTFTWTRLLFTQTDTFSAGRVRLKGQPANTHARLRSKRIFLSRQKLTAEDETTNTTYTNTNAQETICMRYGDTSLYLTNSVHSLTSSGCVCHVFSPFRMHKLTILSTYIYRSSREESIN